MKKLIYVQERFLDPSLCVPFVELSKRNNQEMPYGDESRGGDTFLTTVSTPTEESLTDGFFLKGMDVPESDGNYGAIYLGGEVDPTTIQVDDDELFKTVVHGVTNICKSFDSKVELDYVGVVRWPVGTFMKPHFDKNDVHGADVFAAMLYLNDDFEGGSTVFEHMEVKPEQGKLIIFSNSKYLHHVSEVKNGERYVLSFWYKYPKT